MSMAYVKHIYHKQIYMLSYIYMYVFEVIMHITWYMPE